MFKALKNTLIRRLGGEIPVRSERVEKSEHFTMRRWEASETDRLNKAQKAGARIIASGQSINADLQSHGETIRSFAAFELANNPTLEGVVKTFGDDVVGQNGPGLQILSDDAHEAYNSALETVCSEVLDDLDASGKMALPEKARLWMRSLWSDGEFLDQIVTDPGAATAVKLRLKGVHPRRLATPPALVGEPDVTLGVRRSALGRAVSYTIAEQQILGVWELYTGKFTEIPAEGLIHEYLVTEPGQVRGVPWLATSLAATSDMRAYDSSVLKAARHAAAAAVYWYSDHTDAEYVEVNEETEIEPGTERTGPPGWKPMMLSPTQPAANYIDYRAERHRDIGRPVGMPLMTVRLDSSKHNYSSARFDAQVYRRGICAVRGWLERRVLNRLIGLIEREATLYALANPSWKHAKALRNKPAEFTIRWTWQGFPHVDDEKEANGQRMRMEDGTLTFTDACLENGLDPDAVLAQLAKDTKKLLAVGITPPWHRNPDRTSAPMQQQPSEELAKLAESEGIDLATLMKAQRGGSGGGSAGAGVDAGLSLNGAQIEAALEVMNKLAAGTLEPAASTELLVAVGIDRKRAEEMVRVTPKGSGRASIDMEFVRNFVLKLLENPTSNALVANSTQIKDLVKASGAPANDEYKDPYVAVVAPPGQLITGNPVKDSEGDIVGSGVEAPAKPDPKESATPPKPAEPAPVPAAREIPDLHLHLPDSAIQAAVRVEVPPPPTPPRVVRHVERDDKGLILRIVEEAADAGPDGNG